MTRLVYRLESFQEPTKAWIAIVLLHDCIRYGWRVYIYLCIYIDGTHTFKQVILALYVCVYMCLGQGLQNYFLTGCHIHTNGWFHKWSFYTDYEFSPSCSCLLGAKSTKILTQSLFVFVRRWMQNFVLASQLYKPGLIYIALFLFLFRETGTTPT